MVQLNQNARRIQFNQNAFEKMDTLEKAYWLGFVYADGCVQRYRLIFCQGVLDAKIIEKFLKFIQHPGVPKKTGDGKKIKMYIYSKRLVGDLGTLGVHPRKSLPLQFPHFLPNDLKRGFILGFLDGEGTVYIHKKGHLVIKFSSGSKEFLKALNDYLNAHIPSFKSRKANVNIDKGAWRVRFVGSYAKDLTKYLFAPELSDIFMKRKLGKALKYIHNAEIV